MTPGEHIPIWLSWTFSPDLVIPAAAALAIYFRGLARRSSAETSGRDLAFLGGVFVTFASLASPIDSMADHLFSAHQVQHMLLRMVGPGLIAFAQPQGTLVSGSPVWLRRGPISRILASMSSRRLFGFLTRPWPSTILFIASLYVWQWPVFHDRAIVDEGVHYLMHLTMLAAGLLFFWVVFDRRGPPKGRRFGARLTMIAAGTLANIPLGALICLKSVELYPAYDQVGRLFGVTALDDERLGGFIIWAPASMMMLIALLVVVHAWGRQEERASRSGRPPLPRASGKANGVLALGLAAFSACVLAASLAVAIIALHWGRHKPQVAASATAALAERIH